MHRLLGLDVGSVRIGVAISDPLRITAQPIEVIERRRRDPFARIAELVATYEVMEIVIGRPLQLNGQTGPAVRAIEAFATELSKRLTLPIHWWDERLTTAAAERIMIAGNARRETRRQSIDKVAAALILQSYLDARRP